MVLDSYACLTAYFGTHSCTKVADAILSSKDGSDPSITVLADHMSHAVHEIRNALKNDLIGLLVL